MHILILVANTDKKSLEEQLEPFNENNDDFDTEKEIICEKNHYKEYVDKIIVDAKDTLKWCKKNERDCGSIENILKLAKNAKTDNEYIEVIKKWEGSYIKQDENGNLYYMYNPNAKIDYYDLGGRWNEWLWDTEKKTSVNQALRKNIDLDIQHTIAILEGEKYYNKVRKEHPNDWWHFLWGNYNENTTVIDYLKDTEYPRPYGFIDNGKWSDEMEYGYEKRFDEWWNSLDPETLISVVDCHI